MVGLLLVLPPFGIAAVIVIPQLKRQAMAASLVETQARVLELRDALVQAGPRALPLCPAGDLREGEPTPWEPSCAEAYAAIGWAPPSTGTFCRYVVEPGDAGHLTIARCDLDGDRHFAVVQAGEKGEPTWVSPPGDF